MANFLGYDVYDLDLSRVKDDSELKILLLQTITKLVIMIEDLDQYIAEKPASLSFSGISNFMDVLLNSCCAEERVMVFPMNSKDHVDLAFLRPGWIDIRIHFPLRFRSIKKSGDELSQGEGAQALPVDEGVSVGKTKGCWLGRRREIQQFESPVGQILVQILQTHPHLLLAAIDQQLENLQMERGAQREEAASSVDLLYKHIAKVKEKERCMALE
ncbi:hypothetical protein C1H46_029217 [Malus baccata]|uniref:ATPase AAA-type core domain-containing protein n=1 Tax=Malus baccata TaxID=106549 RepID=A0A540LFI2_MALBA|nr:hypothetical protein C1H46_029217 [Malus baccata]